MIYQVAPLAGAWVEIMAEVGTVECKAVAPLAGAWVEMDALTA